ncbi:MAG: FtsW/RodA/SpoVE family cell cycle protein [Xanthomonadaceae bacterium]|nr:FtsW/RodA/SpoVE family cell cycle protein [Xanthomonadaceae bacterium]
MAALLALMTVSLLVQSSAGDNALHAVLAQGARFVLGSVALLLLANTTPATLRSWTPWIYAGTLSLMPYQKDRIMVFLNPESAPQGAGWNIIQSKIAIGSGGFSGKGWGESTQAALDFLPEHTTDFAFSVFSEEWGWLGVLLVMALYFFVIARCLWMAMQSKDTYSRLLAGALALTFFIYIVVNGGMVAGFLPVVGVPMPLISYGGTSAVSLLAGFGLIMSAYSHRKYIGD